jgi:hypothetical protein
MTDPLDDVLRLVAEGRLTAEEAAPILDALGHDRGGASETEEPGTAGAPERPTRAFASRSRRAAARSSTSASPSRSVGWRSITSPDSRAITSPASATLSTTGCPDRLSPSTMTAAASGSSSNDQR